jgi:hypothetical protein
MDLKSKIVSLIIILSIWACASVYSQGFFKNESKTSEETIKTSNGVRRAPPGGGPGDQPPGSGSSPVGEGLVILSLLSGGYFMLKKKNSQK